AVAGGAGERLAVYREALARALELTPDALAARQGALRFLDPAAVGCAGHWPAAATAVWGHTVLADARVDICQVRAEDAPKLRCHAGGACDPKGCDVYRKGRYHCETCLPTDPPDGFRCLELEGVHFDFDRAFVRPDGFATLGEVARLLAEGPGRRSMIYGHTDPAGDDAYNKGLSERRARAALAVLTHDAAAWEALWTRESWGRPVVEVMAATTGLPATTPRRALIEAYHRAAVPEPARAERFHDFGGGHRSMGCGELNLLATDEESRRVVVMVYEPAFAPRGLPCRVGDLKPCFASVRPVPATPPGADPQPAFRCAVYRRLAAQCSCRQAPQAPPPDKPLVRVLLTGLSFETEKAFLLPGALGAMRALRRLYVEHAPQAVLVVGHTDRAGRAAYNLTLSRERADATGAFLRDDVDAWLAFYREGRPAGLAWGLREDQHMLSHLADDDGPFYVKTVDGLAGPGTTEAVRRFQAWSRARGAAVRQDGVMDAATRRDLVAAYMATDGATLPDGARLEAHGCGEHHPAVETPDGVAEPENRRVEVFFFPGLVEPPPRTPCGPAPSGCPEHARWLATTARTIDLRQGLSTLRLRVTDDLGQAITGAAVHVNGVAEAPTDTAGEVLARDLLPGRHVVRASRPGFEPAELPVDIPEGATEVQAALTLVARALRVQVRHGLDGGHPFGRLVLEGDDGSARRLGREHARAQDPERSLLEFRELLDGVRYSLYQVFGPLARLPLLEDVPESDLRPGPAGPPPTPNASASPELVAASRPAVGRRPARDPLLSIGEPEDRRHG
ncbi:MAG: OmpA family protein, partial [Planctomycetes bacterium]|nr:OmpA family protein [Planctomycetota bacterium]